MDMPFSHARFRWRRALSLAAGGVIVTKKEIVKAISDEIGLTQLKTKEVVQKTFEAIIEALAEGGRIELRNFGVFEVKRRAARKARNPRTGERVSVPGKYVVTFKPGKEMEQRVSGIPPEQIVATESENDELENESEWMPIASAARGRLLSSDEVRPEGNSRNASE